MNTRIPGSTKFGRIVAGVDFVNLRSDDGYVIGEAIGAVPGVWEDPDGLGAQIRREVCDIIRKRHPACPLSED